MKSAWCFLCLCVASFSFFSCAVPQPSPTKWVYQEKAITLYADCENDLNLYDNSSHTLFVCIYQLSSPNGFNQLSSDVGGLYKLLESGLFDDSVVSVDNKTLYPGDHVEFQFDRAENARFVGIVSGYANMSKQRISRLFKIPEVVDKIGFIRKKIEKKPGKLKVNMTFGPYSIEKSNEGS